MDADLPPSPTSGFRYPFRGLKFLASHPRLLGYVAVPLTINTLLYSGFVWFVSSQFGGWLERLLPTGDAWYWTLLSYFLWVVFALFLMAVVIYTFTIIGNLILAPFNDLLSEKVEWVYSGRRLDQPFRLGEFLSDMKRSLKAELGRLLLFAAGFLVLLSLNLVPVFGTAAYGLLFTLYTLFFLGWEYLDYSMERSRFSFSDKRRTVGTNLPSLLGFGAAAAVLLFVPLLNLLAIPICVTGATLLFCDLRASGRLSGEAPTSVPVASATRPRDSR
jgi:CysZ protein